MSLLETTSIVTRFSTMAVISFILHQENTFGPSPWASATISANALGYAYSLKPNESSRSTVLPG